MRNRVKFVLGAAVLTVAFPAAALADAQAPPTLTPAVARAAAAACPGAAGYADALVRGITSGEAAAAAPKFAACAKQVRFPEFQWKNQYAAVALGAVELSRGLLGRDPASLRRAADATAEFVGCGNSELVRNATLINAFARTGAAPLRVPATSGRCAGSPGFTSSWSATDGAVPGGIRSRNDLRDQQPLNEFERARPGL